nr:GYDIA family GHMP kinase [uncultured Carboxylicivirga sp.]
MNKTVTQKFHANGKLLITAEYLVLKGAKALAVPLIQGQSLTISPANEFTWEAYTPKDIWFKTSFDHLLNITHSNSTSEAEKLKNILHKAVQIKPSLVNELKEKRVITHLEFNKDWGWGSSSTLIALLSKWLDVNPYELLTNTFGGSGYDIACAIKNYPIIYQTIDDKNIVQKSTFNPAFKDHIYFVYSGKKQTSSNEVKRFLKEGKISNDVIQSINHITNEMSLCNNINDFGRLMHLHEDIIGKCVQQMPIKTKHFKDFKGYIKSLGAWGGDFFMVVTEHDDNYIDHYFRSKGLKTFFKYNDIVLNSNN